MEPELLMDPSVAAARTRAIGHRLLPILVLWVLTSGLTLTALVYLLQTTTRQRVDRARDGVTEEVTRIAKRPADVVEPYRTYVIGMRGGVWDDARSPASAPESWVSPIQAAVQASHGGTGMAIQESAIGESTIVVAAEPANAGGVAWAAVLVRPVPELMRWQWIVMLLAVATGLLVTTSAYFIVTFQRGAASVRASLAALAHDLDAPIPQPSLRELSDVAEGIARLATNLREARKEEARLNVELAQKERLAALGRVVAGVAHEVRNPLASIKLRLDLAAAGVALPAIASDAIANASSEIARLDRLVADLLVVSGRAPGPRARGSLGALVRSRMAALQPWFEERGVSVDISGDAHAVFHADAVARAVDNLLRNAVEASARGGRITVQVSPPPREGSAGLRLRAMASVRVVDYGAGVASDREAELFEPFFTTKAEGTGLGLALSRAIARQHEGDVTYAREGDATCFELTIPGAASEGADGEPAAESGQRPKRKERAA